MAHLKAVLVEHHDDPSCEEKLNPDGSCPKCKLVPDMQTTCFYCYCPNCDVKLKNMICHNC